jgi:thioredoxin reductase (NADPH)
MSEKIKCLIIGSGPAGYTAGIYASRANLNPVLIEGIQPGGQLTITCEVENFPGYPKGESGSNIMEDLRQQAINCGTDIRAGIVTQIDFSKRPFRCFVDDTHEFIADSVIVATGATARWLGLESEEKYRGFGVSACATCDGHFFKGKDVAVIGGGDTALEEARYLANLCRKVYLVHRRDAFRASPSMQKLIFNTPNVEIVWNHIPKEILGTQQGFMKSVTGLLLRNTQDGSEQTIAIDGVFIAIGTTPVTDLFKDVLEQTPEGYIKTQPTPFTNIKGVFAAGDVQDLRYRQAITAAASGCMAAIEASRFLNEE